MRIILLDDDVRLGDKGNVVNVKRGYAVNYLIPEKKAMIFNKSNQSMIDNELKQKAKRIAKEKAEHQKVADKLNNLELEYTVKAALTGHIYGSITNINVSEKIKELTDIDVPKNKIAISTHIKTAGKYYASIKLFSGINVNVTIIVKIEEEQQEKKSK
jgi:large subunit ribosomal protein L9